MSDRPMFRRLISRWLMSKRNGFMTRASLRGAAAPATLAGYPKDLA
jgi:hypothetical protein